MRTAKISSLDVSVVGLGCNNMGRALDAAGTDAVVGAALDAGVTFFDTADVYGQVQSEGLLGRAIGSRRDQVVVATKFGSPLPGVEGSGGASPRWARQAVTDSLRRLGTDYIDLYYLHRPDGNTPIADTLEALDELVKAGRVREIACSAMTAQQIDEAAAAAADTGRSRFVATQVEYSLVRRAPETNGVLDAVRAHDMALVPYYPLANGLLTGKVKRGDTPKGRLQMDRYAEYLSDANFDIVERLEAVATEHGRTLLELAVGWLLSHPEVPSVIAGATKPEQVQANAAAAARPLSDDEVAAVRAASAPNRSIPPG
jgi:aryl-alcohol dehydrogenase-like predicted oxidoreductase